MSRTTGTTSHGNHHSLVAKLPDVSLLIKHMAGDSIFEEKLGQCGTQNSNVFAAFVDPFSEGTACFSSGITLSRYVASVRGNWNNYDIGPVTATSDDKSNDKGNDNVTGNADPGGPPDDPNELYGVYD